MKSVELTGGILGHRLKRHLRGVAAQGGMWLWLAVSCIPFVFVLVTSIKSENSAIAIPPQWTFAPTGANFREVWSGENGAPDFRALLLHSVIMTIAVTAGTTLFGVLAAYGLSQRALRARRFISNWILSTYMFPSIVTVVPVFFVENKLHALGSYPGIILPELSFNLPIVTWLVRRSIQEIPLEVEEAATVDGASRIKVLSRVVLPLAKPAVSTAAILTAILSWNEFVYAVSLTNGSTETAPVAVVNFTGMYGTEWGQLTAASVLITAPMVLLALVLRRRLVAGLTLGAVK
jgi:ABC-type glycerol-3-phosphate transport system permease component